MKKVSILALHLWYGGIERCIVSLANTLCDKYIVEVAVCYKLFDYEQDVGRLLWKGKLYRLDAEQNKKFREMLLKDMEENDANSGN